MLPSEPAQRAYIANLISFNAFFFVYPRILHQSIEFCQYPISIHPYFLLFFTYLHILKARIEFSTLDDNFERKNLCLSRDSNTDLQFSVLAALPIRPLRHVYQPRNKALSHSSFQSKTSHSSFQSKTSHVTIFQRATHKWVFLVWIYLYVLVTQS